MATPHTWVTGETVTAAMMNQEVRDKVTLCTSSTHPSGPYAGQVIFETDTSLLKTYDGTAFQTVLLANQKSQMIVQSGNTGIAGTGWASNNSPNAVAEYRQTVDGFCQLSGQIYRTDPTFSTTAGTFYTIGFVPSSMAPTDGYKQFATWSNAGPAVVLRISTAGVVSFCTIGVSYTCTQNVFVVGIECSWWL